MLEINRFILFI